MPRLLPKPAKTSQQLLVLESYRIEHQYWNPWRYRELLEIMTWRHPTVQAHLEPVIRHAADTPILLDLNNLMPCDPVAFQT